MAGRNSVKALSNSFSPDCASAGLSPPRRSPTFSSAAMTSRRRGPITARLNGHGERPKRKPTHKLRTSHMTTSLVLTFVGDDRPGLVNAVSEKVADFGGTWLESRSVRLAGKFAGVVLVRIPDENFIALEFSSGEARAVRPTRLGRARRSGGGPKIGALGQAGDHWQRAAWDRARCDAGAHPPRRQH